MAEARRGESAARPDAGGAEPRNGPSGCQRRQRERQGRVTEAHAHIAPTLSKGAPGGEGRCRRPRVSIRAIA